MAYGARALQGGDHAGVVEYLADQTQALFGMVALAVVADDAGGFLAAVLQGVQAEGREGGGVRRVPHAKHAAFFVRLVVVEPLCLPLCLGIGRGRDAGDHSAPFRRWWSGVVRCDT